MSLSSVTNSQVSWQFQRGLFSVWAGLEQGRAEGHPCTGLASTCRGAGALGRCCAGAEDTQSTLVPAAPWALIMAMCQQNPLCLSFPRC